jgi:hypothetical protein
MSGGDQIRVQAVCAPDRKLHQTTLDPDAAITLVHSQLRGEFPTEPAFSMPGHGVRFERNANGLTDGYAWVWASGRLDYDTYVPPRIDDGRVVVPVLEILRPISVLAGVIRTPEYSRVFGQQRLPRRRFDWFIGVSPSIVLAADGITRPWTDLQFPGRVARRAGTNQQPFCPADGYAKSALTSWDPHRPIKELLRAFLEDFLHQNGYHDCDGAIEDTLNAFTRASDSVQD